ncbi:MAG: lipid-A-disaccharide synthase [Acidobacteriota bacterium]|nr:lipid-A-disaccharide synthase [Acidobacteriota bacterium]
MFLSAGEASGDHYGARLIAELKQRLPAATFTGLGGDEMATEGQQQTVRAEDVAVMGITEILRHIPRIVVSYRKLVRSIRRDKPAVAVLIDFPDINFRLAKRLHAVGVPVIWFVSPQLWAWKRSRLRWVRQRVSKMLVIFPFEETFYRNRGVAAEFIGHPLAEAALPTISREDYAMQHALDPAKIWIALLPGSRWKEIRANLPALHELAVSDLIATHSSGITFDGDRLELPTDAAAHTRFEFLLPVASTIDRARLEAYLQTLNAEHVKYLGPEASTLRLTLVPEAREALFHARASVVASGTATIQAAVIGNPLVVVYRVSPLTFALAKKLVEYPAEFPDMADASGNQPIAMVNLIAQRRLVPELLQQNFTAANVAQALAPLLVDGPERQQQIGGLAEVRRRLQPLASQSSISRLADAVLAALNV